MAKQKLSILCQCGKKYRVNHTRAAAFVCKDCGQTIHLPETGKLPLQHWSFNVLLMVWAIPACILFAGLLYIFVLERSDKPEKTPVETPTVAVPANGLPETVEEPEDATLVEQQRANFPEDQLLHIDSLTVNNGYDHLLTLDGKLEIVDGRIVNQTSVNAAVQLCDVVSDFEVKLDGTFPSSGATYFFLGWDPHSNSGYLIRYDRLVTFGQWWITQIKNGQPASEMIYFSGEKVSKGQLRMRVKNKHLSIDFENVRIVEEMPLQEYEPGIVMFGAGHGRYSSKGLSLASIEILNTPAKKRVAPKDDSLAVDVFSKTPVTKIFPGGNLRRPTQVPLIGSTEGKIERATETLTEVGGLLVSAPKEITAIELDSLAGNFELRVSGEMAGKGNLFWLFGWDQEKQKGYRLNQSQLIKSDIWKVRSVENGKLNTGTAIANHRIPIRSEICIRMIDKSLQIELDGKIIVERILLKDYQPGRLLMGTAPNEYGGRDIRIESITISE